MVWNCIDKSNLSSSISPMIVPATSEALFSDNFQAKPKTRASSLCCSRLCQKNNVYKLVLPNSQKDTFQYTLIPKNYSWHKISKEKYFREAETKSNTSSLAEKRLFSIKCLNKSQCVKSDKATNQPETHLKYYNVYQYSEPLSKMNGSSQTFSHLKPYDDPLLNPATALLQLNLEDAFPNHLTGIKHPQNSSSGNTTMTKCLATQSPSRFEAVKHTKVHSPSKRYSVKLTLIHRVLANIPPPNVPERSASPVKKEINIIQSFTKDVDNLSKEIEVKPDKSLENSDYEYSFQKSQASLQSLHGFVNSSGTTKNSIGLSKASPPQKLSFPSVKPVIQLTSTTGSITNRKLIYKYMKRFSKLAAHSNRLAESFNNIVAHNNKKNVLRNKCTSLLKDQNFLYIKSKAACKQRRSLTDIETAQLATDNIELSYVASELLAWITLTFNLLCSNSQIKLPLDNAVVQKILSRISPIKNKLPAAKKHNNSLVHNTGLFIKSENSVHLSEMSSVKAENSRLLKECKSLYVKLLRSQTDIDQYRSRCAVFETANNQISSILKIVLKTAGYHPNFVNQFLLQLEQLNLTKTKSSATSSRSAQNSIINALSSFLNIPSTCRSDDAKGSSCYACMCDECNVLNESERSDESENTIYKLFKKCFREHSYNRCSQKKSAESVKSHVKNYLKYISQCSKCHDTQYKIRDNQKYSPISSMNNEQSNQVYLINPSYEMFEAAMEDAKSYPTSPKALRRQESCSFQDDTSSDDIQNINSTNYSAEFNQKSSSVFEQPSYVTGSCQTSYISNSSKNLRRFSDLQSSSNYQPVTKELSNLSTARNSKISNRSIGKQSSKRHQKTSKLNSSGIVNSQFNLETENSSAHRLNKQNSNQSGLCSSSTRSNKLLSEAPIKYSEYESVMEKDSENFYPQCNAHLIVSHSNITNACPRESNVTSIEDNFGYYSSRSNLLHENNLNDLKNQENVSKDEAEDNVDFQKTSSSPLEMLNDECSKKSSNSSSKKSYVWPNFDNEPSESENSEQQIIHNDDSKFNCRKIETSQSTPYIAKSNSKEIKKPKTVPLLSLNNVGCGTWLSGNQTNGETYQP